MKTKKKILISMFIILCSLIIFLIFFYNYINKVKIVKIEKTDEQLSVSTETAKKSEEKGIENILLLGIDDIENASDTIMILTLDKKNNELKLTSIMRDTYVYLGEGTANKINYAYNYGGVELTITKLNEMFNLDLRSYIKLDIDGFASIIDYLGGVEVDISEEMRIAVNDKMDSIIKDENLPSDHFQKITTRGKVNLNGAQALAYVRTRTIDSDFQRTKRQREVMLKIFEKVEAMSVTSYPKIVSDLTSNIETNMSTLEMLEGGNFIFSIEKDRIKDFRVPLDGTTSDYTEGVYHLDWNQEVNIEALDKFIYGE